MMSTLEEWRFANVAWIISEYLCKKALGIKEYSDICGGHYVTKIERALGYYVEREVAKCSEPIEYEEWKDKLKHGYGYLEEIVVRRADNALCRFKEGDFPRLRINDIEDMLLLVVQNRLTNLLGDDVVEFAIALRMFTRSLFIQKRVEDL
ncbi:hypothetical protein Tco_1581477 [Tanacetum coccineum]